MIGTQTRRSSFTPGSFVDGAAPGSVGSPIAPLVISEEAVGQRLDAGLFTLDDLWPFGGGNEDTKDEAPVKDNDEAANATDESRRTAFYIIVGFVAASIVIGKWL